MSFDPIKQPIAPFKLFNDALAQVVPIYLTLLIISSPGILVTLLQSLAPQTLKIAIVLIYSVTIAPIIGGIGMDFNYRYLQQGTIDLKAAVDKALAHSLQLILGSIIYFVAMLVGTIFFIIPGIYIAIRFWFVLYAIISENCSAIDGFKYSSKLVAGR